MLPELDASFDLNYLQNPTPDDGVRVALDLLLHDDDTPLLNIDPEQTLDPTPNDLLTSTVPSPINSQSSHTHLPNGTLSGFYIVLKQHGHLSTCTPPPSTRVVIRSPHDPEVPSSNPGKNNTSDFSIRDPLSLPSCDWYRIYLAMWWNSSVGRAADLIYTCQVRCRGFDSRCFPHI